jgi:hypothetical protein
MNHATQGHATDEQVFPLLCKQVNQDNQVRWIKTKIGEILSRHFVITEAHLRTELASYAERLTDGDGKDMLCLVLEQMVLRKQLQRWQPYPGMPPSTFGNDDFVYLMPSQGDFDVFDSIEQLEPQITEQTTRELPQTPLSLANRLAAAACKGSGICEAITPKTDGYCAVCRQMSAAVAAELAKELRERHGGSTQVADMLDGLLG